jgi:hypothetical protein
LLVSWSSRRSWTGQTPEAAQKARERKAERQRAYEELKAATDPKLHPNLQRCSNCRFSWYDNAPFGGGLKCRFDPPQVNRWNQGKFRPVKRSHWCGKCQYKHGDSSGTPDGSAQSTN